MKERNCSIDIFRMFCAFFVVSCHAEMLYDIDPFLDMAVTHVWARFTVPFFFTVAGYYYIIALLRGKDVFGKQLKALVRVYVTWSAIYFSFSLVKHLVEGTFDFATFAQEKIFDFFTIGSQYHLWYMVALIYTLIIVTVVFKVFGEKGIKILSIISFVISMICAFGCVYYPIGSQIPVLADFYATKAFTLVAEWFGMGVAYFTLGYIVYKVQDKFLKMSNKTIWILWGITLVIYMAEILLIVFKVQYFERLIVLVMVYFFIAMNMLLLIKNPLPKYTTVAKYCKSLSGFVYFAHVLILSVIELVFSILNIELFSILRYALVMIIAIGVGYFLEKSNWKIKKYLM